MCEFSKVYDYLENQKACMYIRIKNKKTNTFVVVKLILTNSKIKEIGVRNSSSLLRLPTLTDKTFDPTLCGVLK